MQKFKEIRGSRHIYKNDLDKVHCQYKIAYGGFNYLAAVPHKIF